MTTNKLQALVTEAVSLDRKVAGMQDRLTHIKTQLRAEADTRPDEHTPTDLGGWSWTAEGHDGCIARVTVDGGKLKSSISTDKDIAKAKDLAGPVFSQLFEPKLSYILVSGFRERATTLLGKAAPRLIKTFTGTGAVKVAFETKDPPQP